jgi:SAM-dependent methyltransferase
MPVTTTDETPDALAVWTLINSHVVSRCIHVIADFGVADVLDDEPVGAEQLAARTGLDADALARMLRLLSAHGLFALGPDGYVHTPRSELLRSDHPQSMRSFARMIGTSSWAAFTDLAEPARTGRPARGWQAMMAHFAEHPDEAALFSQAMVDKSATVAPAVVEAYDFSSFAKIVDVGGGTGRLLATILERCPEVTGVLFELPHVIADAEDAASDRLRLVAGDFFADALPEADAYVLMEVLHDWTDEDAARILAAVRRAAAPGARLIVVEVLVPDTPGPDHSKLLDIIMLAVTGGRERTRDQYEKLFADAGFRFERVVPTRSSYFVVEARAV